MLRRTASGSVAVPGTRARVAKASRIFVEGRHDAELVEKVWGDDLRVEGVVVEYLDGIDDLAEQLRDFRPAAERRVGVLVDHLVPGSKESRIAASVAPCPAGGPAPARSSAKSPACASSVATETSSAADNERRTRTEGSCWPRSSWLR